MTEKTIYASFTREAANTDQRTIPAVLSTDTGVQRGDYTEILQHASGSIDLSRFPLPVLVSHDSGQLNIAIAENPAISGGKLRANIRFGESDQAKQIFSDVQTGIITGLSVGYEWLEYVEEQGKTIKVTRWQPLEVSIVSVPADQNAGFFRNKQMPDPVNTVVDENEVIDPKIMKRAATMERERINAIRKFGKMSRSSQATIEEFITRGVDLDTARERMLESWSKEVDSECIRGDAGIGSVESFGGHGDVREAITDGLLLRAGIKVEKPHVASRDFQNTSIVQIAGMLLRDRGDYGSDQSPSNILKRAMSASDLPYILENIANKAMIGGFAEVATTHDQFVSFRQVIDFKEQSRLALSSFENLQETPELSEVQYSGLTDSKETYKIKSYQRAISFSRQMLINDDLSQLTDMPARMGASAKRTESDLVYSILTDSHVMADTIELFHASRGNLIDDVLDAVGLGAAISILRKAKDIGNRGYLGLRPAWLIVSPDQELAALQILASLSNPTANANAVPGSDFAKIKLIVEPRIESATDWYLLGEGVERIEVGQLNDNGISFETENNFSTDAMNMKVRLDCGAKALSPLAMIKSTGDAA
ncbi:MAG: HK97 family phage prohead protease [Methylobacter sp.]|uniref:phage major capsid protein n=1 Tax=Methylobacter sp. TaxID=2051955 RepID=UPI002730FD12|nr:HK97 family phage prohead protease [Methylobacter sp.]MDP1665517.1 HK97 family phage prohead protease [Methylobacter sp.]